MQAVSLIVPTFNGSQFLRDALQSVSRQTWRPMETIIVDDGSSDDSPGVAERLGHEFQLSVKVLRLGRNSGGPATPMNVGVAAATSSIVALCDQDDVLPPDRLERQATALDRVPTAGLACGVNVAIGPDGQEINQYTSSAESWAGVPGQTIAGGCRRIAAEAAYRSLLQSGHSVGGASSMCFPKRVWQEVGGFNPEFRIAWDYDFAVRVAAKRDFVFDETPLSFHRLHEGNLGHRLEVERVESATIRWRQFRKPAFSIPMKERREALARESIRLGYEFRERGRYWDSAKAYFGHFCYGQPVRAASGLAKLAILAVIPDRFRLGQTRHPVGG